MVSQWAPLIGGIFDLDLLFRIHTDQNQGENSEIRFDSIDWIVAIDGYNFNFIPNLFQRFSAENRSGGKILKVVIIV